MIISLRISEEDPEPVDIDITDDECQLLTDEAARRGLTFEGLIVQIISDGLERAMERLKQT